MNIFIEGILDIYLPKELVGLLLTSPWVYRILRSLSKSCKRLVDELLMPLRAKYRFTIKTTQYENSATRKLVKTTNKLPNGNLNGEITKLSFDTNGTFCVQEWWLDGEPLHEFGYYYDTESSVWRRERISSYVSYGESAFIQLHCQYRGSNYNIEFDPATDDRSYLQRKCGKFEITEREISGGYQLEIMWYHRALGDDALFIEYEYTTKSKWWETFENEYYLLSAVLERYPGFLCGVVWDEDPVAGLQVGV